MHICFLFMSQTPNLTWIVNSSMQSTFNVRTVEIIKDILSILYTMLRYSAKRWQPHDMYEDWSMAISSLWVISNRRAGYNHPQRVAEAATILWILIKLYDYIWLLYDIIDPFYTFLHPKSVAQAIYNNPYNSFYGPRSSKLYLKYSKILQKRSLVHGCRSCDG